MLFADFPEWRDLLSAFLLGKLASGPKAAPLRQIRKVRGLAINRVQLGFARLVESRNRMQQPQGIGMPGSLVDIPGDTAFDDLSRIHDVDPVGIAGHDSQVMRDDDDGHVETPAGVLQ